ncbi:HAD domain-containing protein, partial [Acinetobacter baumannii]
MFLDFDGVLHPDEVYRVGERIVLRMDGFSLFEWSEVLDELMEPYPALQIVLATSWVRQLGFDVARAYLPDSLQRRVVG